MGGKNKTILVLKTEETPRNYLILWTCKLYIITQLGKLSKCIETQSYYTTKTIKLLLCEVFLAK